jgi:MFS family permease
MLQATFALYGEAVLFSGYSEQVVTIGVGLLLTAVGLGQVFTQTFLLRRILPKLGEAKLVILGLVIRTAGLVIFAAITTPWLGPVASILFAMGMGLMMPPLQSIATKAVSDDVRGGVLGLYQSVINLSIIISTAVGGLFFAISPATPYWIGSGISLLVIFPALLLLRQSRLPIKVGFGD